MRRLAKIAICFSVTKANAVITIKMPICLLTVFSKMPTSADLSTHPSFDYASLDAATASFVQQQTGELRVLIKRTTQDIVEIGRKLIYVKDKLKHGQFGEWLAAEFEWSQDSASNFMRVAQQFGDNPIISEFAPSALYLLSAPSTPETAREEALTRAAAGESITYSTAKQIKSKYTPARSKRKPSVKETLENPGSTPPEAADQPAALPQPQPQKQVTQKPRPKQEILAVLPKKVEPQNVTQPDSIVSPKSSTIQSASIPAGSWWQVEGRHLLYCGNPNSPRFQERLPDSVSLQLAFPPERNNWQESVSPKVKSALSLWSSYQDQDVNSLHKIVDEALRLYTESEETTVFLFLPDPQLLILAHKLDCQCIIAEPDLVRCQTALRAWQGRAMKIQQVKTLRF